MADDIQSILQSSLFQRVPAIAADLIRDGMEPHAAITQAIGIAKEREDDLCLMMLAPQGHQQAETAALVQEYLCERVYGRLCGTSPPPARNPQWEACATALGREPEGWEFINWIRAQKGGG